MGYLIKLDMENMVEEFKNLLEDFLQSREYELEEDFEILDNFERYEFDVEEPNIEYSVFFNVKGIKKEYISRIELERVHLQYNFDDEILYGFFEVSSYLVCEPLRRGGEFIGYISRKSRER